MNLREGIVEALDLDPDYLDPDYLDADEYPNGRLIEMVANMARENDQLRDLVAKSWTIVHKRARVVLVGDLVAAESGKTWHVVDVTTNAFETTITMTRGLATKLIERTTSRDAAIPVLMPIPTRDGLVLLRGGLGAQLVPIEDEPVDEPPPIEGAWRDGQVHTCPLTVQPHVALRDCVKYALDHGDRTFVGDPSFVPEITEGDG